jgi:transcriptional regulator with XRE-family HTH domain
MSTKKMPVQRALIVLRSQLDLTQEALARELRVSPVSVCRWETIRPPSGFTLLQLAVFALAQGARDSAKVFHEALKAEPGQYSSQAQGLYEMIAERLHAA